MVVHGLDQAVEKAHEDLERLEDLLADVRLVNDRGDMSYPDGSTPQTIKDWVEDLMQQIFGMDMALMRRERELRKR
jgi:hypothetical protein